MANIIYKLLKPFIFYKRIIQALFTLVVAVVCFSCYLMLTPGGARLALYYAADLTGYKLSFKEIEGNLTHQIKMTDFHFQGSEIDIHAADIDLKWHLLTLLKKDKIFRSLKGNHLNIRFTLDESFTEQPSLKDLQDAIAKALPIPLRIENIELTDSIVSFNQFCHEVKTLTIKQATSKLYFEEIHYEGTYGNIEAYLQNAIRVKWNLHFTPPLFLEKYFMSEAITTRGEILLPHQKLSDLDNYIDIQFKTNFLKTNDHQFQDLDLIVKGTPNHHQLNCKTVYQDKPLDVALTGKLNASSWQGKINSLLIKNTKWLDKGKIEGDAHIDWEKETLKTNLSLMIFERYPLKVIANVDKKKPYTLSGTLQSRLQDIKTLDFLIPELSNIQGKLDLNLKLAGNLLAPLFSGDLLLTEGHLKTNYYGNKISLSRLQLVLQENHSVKINGEGGLKNGSFNIIGEGVLFDQHPNLKLNIKGKSLLLSDTPEFYIVADPDLTLTLENGVPKIAGTIVVPKADIQSLKNADAINPSSDVVIVKKGKPQKPLSTSRSAQLPAIPTQVEIILGDNITYKGHGLSTKVKGKIEISQAENDVPLAKGKFTLHEGKYHAYSKEFDVRYGQILFSGGPISDPILDIQAQRKVRSRTPSSIFRRNAKKELETQHQNGSYPSIKAETTGDIVVGVKLSGNLKSPRLDFFSSPSMPEADVLSYLVVGRPQGEISEAQAEILFQAATQLAGFISKSGNMSKLNIAQQLKLDQFGLSKKPDTFASSKSLSGNKNMLEDTVFVLGKQLSDKLYLNYSVGILDSASNFGLRYALGKNLMLEAATGSQGSSADLLLSFEGK